MGVKVLVLDEADRLLAMGFHKDIERIIAAVPKQRQTLFFSATVPEEVSFFIPSVYWILMFHKFEEILKLLIGVKVHQICHIALRRDREFINTVEEGTEETHSQVDFAACYFLCNMEFSSS